MEALREFLKGWKGKALLVVFLLPLVVTGFESIVRSHDDPNAIAKVGDESISANALQNSLNERRQALLAQVDGNASLLQENLLHDQVLQRLIERALLMQQSKNLGFRVSDATITQMLATEPSFLDASGKFSNELFASFLKQRGMTKDQLFEMLRGDMTLSAFSNGILATAIYPKALVDELIAQQNQTRPLWVARLPWQNFVNQVSVSDSEISQYYNQHKATLVSPETVDVSYLELDPATLNVPAPTPDEINQAYQAYLARADNQPEYDLAMILINDKNAEQTLTQLKQTLDKQPDAFGKLAQQYSQDDGSKNNGGNIGPISQAMFPKDYASIMAAVKNLQVGQITNPIKTQYGYQLFKLNKINGQQPPSLASVQPMLEQQAREQKRQAIYQDLISKINNEAAGGASLSEIAKQHGLSVHTLNQYPKTANQTALNQPAVINAAFNAQSLQDGTPSVGLDVGGRMVWLQSKNHQPSHPMTLAQATAQIKSTLTQAQAKQLALTQAQQLANTVRQQNSTTNLPVSFTSLGNATRQSPALLAEERQAAFAVPAIGDKLAVNTQATEQGASVLVGGSISQAASQTPQATAELQQQLGATLKSTIGQAQLDDYLAYLHSHIPVSIKPAANTP